MARWIASGGALVAVVALAGACSPSATSTRPSEVAGPARAAPPPAPRPEITGPSLHFQVQPADATVAVDDMQVGTAAEVRATGGIAVEPGIHTITIERAGFVTWRTEISVKDQPERLEVVLERSGG